MIRRSTSEVLVHATAKKIEKLGSEMQFPVFSGIELKILENNCFIISLSHTAIFGVLPFPNLRLYAVNKGFV